MANRSNLISQPSMSDCDFVKEVPDNLTCSICLGVIQDPHLLSCCGIKYCQTCISPVKSNCKPCPKCREPNYETMLDKEMQRAVLNLEAHCIHRHEGCQWVGEVRYLQAHLNNKCQYVGVACKYCKQNFSKQVIESHETKECPQLPMEIKMMNELRNLANRVQQLETHCEYWKNQSVVLKEEITEDKKKYDEAIANMQTETEKDREKYQQELTELKGTVAVLTKDKQQTEEKRSTEKFEEAHFWAMKCQTYTECLNRSFRDWDIPKWQTPPSVVFSSSVPPCQFIMNNFTGYLDSRLPWFSRPFYSWPGGYKLCLKVYASGETGKHVSVSVALLGGEYDEQLKWPVDCVAKVTMLNLLRNSGHVTHAISVEPLQMHCLISPSSKRKSIPTGTNSKWFDSKTERLSPDILKKTIGSKGISMGHPMSSSVKSTECATAPDSTKSLPPPTLITKFISHASLSENAITNSRYCGTKDSVIFRVQQCLERNN